MPLQSMYWGRLHLTLVLLSLTLFILLLVKWNYVSVGRAPQVRTVAQNSSEKLSDEYFKLNSVIGTTSVIAFNTSKERTITSSNRKECNCSIKTTIIDQAKNVKYNVSKTDFQRRNFVQQYRNSVSKLKTNVQSAQNRIFHLKTTVVPRTTTSRVILPSHRYKSVVRKKSIMVKRQNITGRLEFICPSQKRLPIFVEDILCTEKPAFLENFKNPCWVDQRDGRFKCFPYFHIFGVCKSGTTDLFHKLVLHPQIIPNRGLLSKETLFWSWRRYGVYMKPVPAKLVLFPRLGYRKNVSNSVVRGMTLDGFVNYFDSAKILNDVTMLPGGKEYHKLITGHGDPMDLWDISRWRLIAQNDPLIKEPDVTTPYLVRHVNPNVKLIAILREPSERCYSHYLHGNYGKTRESFHMHVEETIRHLKECEKQGRLRECVYEPEHRTKIKAPLHASLYYLHLSEWFKVFPREQILIIQYDEYQNNGAETLRQVFHHLNVDPLSEDDLLKINNIPKKYVSKKKAVLGPMFTETQNLLSKYFKDSIYKLASLLNDRKYLKWTNVKQAPSRNIYNVSNSHQFKIYPYNGTKTNLSNISIKNNYSRNNGMFRTMT